MKNFFRPLVLTIAAILACEYAEASYEKGVEARKNGDYAEALKQWMVASDDPRCMTAIGVMYDYGEGVPGDDAQAAEWYARAAGEGEYRAIAQLANFSLTGAGGVKEPPAEWRKKLEAIEGKDSYADYILACFYMDGYGGEKNLTKASYILKGLTEKGYTQLETVSRQAERRLADEKTGVKEADTLIAGMVQASFDQEVKDRRIAVSGWVNAVDRLGSQGYVVKFGGPQASANPKDNILAVFYAPSRTAPFASLTPRTFVRLDGVYVGKHPFPLEDCALTLFGCTLLDVVSDDAVPGR